MLKISLSFDPEFEPSAKDPLGDLKFCDDRGQILVRDTYLDTWFAALTDACRRLLSVNRVVRELGEPGDLIIEKLPDGRLRLNFGDQSGSVESLSDFGAEVNRATDLFLGTLRSFPDFDETYFPRMLKSITEWKYGDE